MTNFYLILALAASLLFQNALGGSEISHFTRKRGVPVMPCCFSYLHPILRTGLNKAVSSPACVGKPMMRGRHAAITAGLSFRQPVGGKPGEIPRVIQWRTEHVMASASAEIGITGGLFELRLECMSPKDDAVRLDLVMQNQFLCSSCGRCVGLYLCLCVSCLGSFNL